MYGSPVEYGPSWGLCARIFFSRFVVLPSIFSPIFPFPFYQMTAFSTLLLPRVPKLALKREQKKSEKISLEIAAARAIKRGRSVVNSAAFDDIREILAAYFYPPPLLLQLLLYQPKYIILWRQKQRDAETMSYFQYVTLFAWTGSKLLSFQLPKSITRKTR